MTQRRRRRRGPAGAAVTSQGLSCNQTSPLANNACEVKPAPCGVDILGATTRVTDAAGVAAGGVGTLTLTAGDSCQFQPISMYIGAFLAIAGALLDPAAVRKTILLTSLKVGNVEALRRQGAAGNGINTDPFNAEQYGPQQIRVGPFSSTQGQNLVMEFTNWNNAAMQYSAVVWGFAIN